MSLAILKMKLKGKTVIKRAKTVTIPLMNKTIQVKKNLANNSDFAELVRKCMTIRVDLLE
jgi:hypothetical protein